MATTSKPLKYVPRFSFIRDTQIKLFFLEDSDTCYKLLEEVAIVMATIGVAAELDVKMKTSEAEKKLAALRKAIALCQTIIYTDMWDVSLHREIDDGLEATKWLEKKVSEVYKLTAQLAKTEP